MEYYDNEGSQLYELGKRLREKRELSARETDDAIPVIIVHLDRVVSDNTFTDGDNTYRVMVVNIDGD